MKKIIGLTLLAIVVVLGITACGADNEPVSSNNTASPAATTDTSPAITEEVTPPPLQQDSAFNLPESITGGRAYQVFELDEPVSTGIDGVREWVFGSNITFVPFPEEYAEDWPHLDLIGKYAVRVPVSVTNRGTGSWPNGLWRANLDFDRFNPYFEEAFAVVPTDGGRGPLVEAFDGHEHAQNNFDGNNRVDPDMTDYGYYYLFFYEGDGDYWVRFRVSHVPGIDYHFVRIPIHR